VSRSLGSSPGGEDSRGPETRNAAARRRAAAASVSAAAKAASEGESEVCASALVTECVVVVFEFVSGVGGNLPLSF
jgi:hypothetical protein